MSVNEWRRTRRRTDLPGSNSLIIPAAPQCKKSARSLPAFCMDKLDGSTNDGKRPAFTRMSVRARPNADVCPALTHQSSPRTNLLTNGLYFHHFTMATSLHCHSCKQRCDISVYCRAEPARRQNGTFQKKKNMLGNPRSCNEICITIPAPLAAMIKLLGSTLGAALGVVSRPFVELPQANSRRFLSYAVTGILLLLGPGLACGTAVAASFQDVTSP